MNDAVLKYFLLFYFLLYYGVLFLLNSYLVYKKTGKNPYVLGKGEGVISFTERSIKAAGVLIPVVLFFFIISKALYEFFVPIRYLEEDYYNLFGILLMILGFTICLTAQYYMRTSWRIGIDRDSKIDLVTNGIFKYSRNPFFVGTLITYTGFFFILPNIISFTIGVLYYFLIQIQVRLEEDNLLKLLGDKYGKYYSAVRRWI